MFVTDAHFSTAELEDYRPFVGDDVVDRIQARAAVLQGARILQVNATAIGGGVAEMLLSTVPLMRGLGLDVDWYVLDADDDFFEITKGYHNALQGLDIPWSAPGFDAYWRGCKENAQQLRGVAGTYDYVIVHDPQPLVLRSLLDGGGHWIWRCHIDLTAPCREVWCMLSPHLAAYDMLVFSAPEYIAPDVVAEKIDTALPCIDPFRPKNRPIRQADVNQVIRKHGVDPERPYILQVSRFDPWKDPVGIVEAYRRLRPEWPDLQLVYMASMASDDPEGRRVYEETLAAAAGDQDIHLLALDVPPSHVSHNALEVNAFQRGARVVMQKSLREGFGLVVTEALWKEKPVVGADVGGIRYQIQDGHNGYLVSSVDECAERVAHLLRDADLAAELGRAGRETVRSRFLLTRYLEQYLGWFGELA